METAQNASTKRLFGGGSLFKYFFGKAFSYSEAKLMQKKMKNSGFFDSFIVGFFEKNKADLSKVLSILEKKN